MSRKSFDQNIPVNIVKADCPGAKDQMRINELRLMIVHAVNLRVRKLLTDVKKHDPPRRWKKKFHLRQIALKKRIEVEIAEGFVVEEDRPEGDENSNNNVTKGVCAHCS